MFERVTSSLIWSRYEGNDSVRGVHVQLTVLRARATRSGAWEDDTTRRIWSVGRKECVCDWVSGDFQRILPRVLVVGNVLSMRVFGQHGAVRGRGACVAFDLSILRRRWTMMLPSSDWTWDFLLSFPYLLSLSLSLSRSVLYVCGSHCCERTP